MRHRPSTPFSQRRIAIATRRTQDRLALGLGIDHAERAETVLSMLRNNARRTPGYWIQLTLATGIATLGLVLGSTAVVIGAMLVSPLMGPIIELGMGFAVGSSLLVMRAAVRVMLSILLVVAGAALMTLALPFHEVTTEISARTAPTALDLLVAVFCALTASYTTVRPGSDSTAAAAGTAIGIALVPPLCVIGFGLGTFSSTTASGAALLFTANLSAILVLSVISFLALGYNQVDAVALEHDFLAPATSRLDRLAHRVHRLIHRAFGSRYGGVMRVLVPAAFLAMVYVPLRQALAEVTWEVRTRDAVRRLVHEEDPHAMQTALTIDRSALTIRLLIVGTVERARLIEDSLAASVAREVGVQPTVSVVAVPDARMQREAAAAEARVPVASVPRGIATVRERAAATLREDFPREAGELLDWTLAMTGDDTARFAVYHTGPPLGASGAELLGRLLAASLGSPTSVTDLAFPAGWLAADGRRTSAWLDSTRHLLQAMAAAPRAAACIEGPGVGAVRAPADARRVLTALEDTPAFRAGRAVMRPGPEWRVRIATSCASVLSPDSTRGTSAPE